MSLRPKRVPPARRMTIRHLRWPLPRDHVVAIHLLRGVRIPPSADRRSNKRNRPIEVKPCIWPNVPQPARRSGETSARPTIFMYTDRDALCSLRTAISSLRYSSADEIRTRQ